MIRSLAIKDILNITIEKDEDERIFQLVRTKGGLEYESKSSISFGIGAVFGYFELILDKNTLQIIKGNSPLKT